MERQLIRYGIQRATLVWFLLGIGAIGLFFGAVSPSAQAANYDLPGDSELETDHTKNEYDFSWLDPDKKIYVLQNRKYLKANRLILSVMGGSGFSNPYRTVYNIDPRATYFINETWGIELFYTYSMNSNSTTFTALQQSSVTVFPSIREIRGQYGARIQFAPWYAKINVFNSILYFDWFFNLGLASMSTFINTPPSATVNVEQNLVGLTFGTGHIFHLDQHLLVRWELTGTVFSAQSLGTSGDSTLFSNYNIGLGIGWKL